MNVLLVTVDSLRVDRVTEEYMPSTRVFADEGLEFTTCLANGPSTPASFPAIHASRYFASIDGLGLPEAGSVVTTAESFQDAGFETAGFTDNHFASGSYNFHRGFGTMIDAGRRSEPGRIKQFVQSNLDKEGVVFRSIERLYSQVDSLFATVTGNESEYVRAKELNHRALEWVDARSDEWFLWLHYMDTHHPYEPPESYQKVVLDEPLPVSTCRRLSRKGTHHPNEVSESEWRTIERLYNAECAYVDDQFEALLQSLEDRDILDETVVCFTADHGELVGEHDHAGHPPEFWEGIIRVPLIIGNIGINDTIEEQVCLIDIPPTLVDCADIDGSQHWQGQSVIAVAEGVETGHRHVFGDIGRDIDYGRCYVRRDDGWKLLRHGPDGEFLFNVRESPEEAEGDDRIDSDPVVYEELSHRLAEHQRRMSAMRKGEVAIDADEDMIEEHLRDLGYL